MLNISKQKHRIYPVRMPVFLALTVTLKQQ
jgi:hypothetical protein